MNMQTTQCVVSSPFHGTLAGARKVNVIASVFTSFMLPPPLYLALLQPDFKSTLPPAWTFAVSSSLLFPAIYSTSTFSFVLVLGFELSFVFARQALYHLGHILSPAFLQLLTLPIMACLVVNDLCLIPGQFWRWPQGSKG
jgi:hypothetical protein